MDIYQTTEQICEDKTRALFPDYNFVRGEINNCWDLSGQTRSLSTNRDCFFLEVKNRDIPSTAHDTSLLESIKLRRLMDYANLHNADVYYLCFYTDGVAYQYNLRNITIGDVYITEKKNMKYKTVEDAGLKDKIFVELPHHLGKKYTYKV